MLRELFPNCIAAHNALIMSERENDIVSVSDESEVNPIEHVVNDSKDYHAISMSLLYSCNVIIKFRAGDDVDNADDDSTRNEYPNKEEAPKEEEDHSQDFLANCMIYKSKVSHHFSTSYFISIIPIMLAFTITFIMQKSLKGIEQSTRIPIKA